LSRQALYIESDDGPPPGPLEPLIASGDVRVVRQVDLAPADLRGARGLITTAYLDQIDFAARQESLWTFLSDGGRIAFNGHVLRAFVDGMQPFVPLASPRRSDLSLTRMSPHPVLDDIPMAALETRMGVAGFYGRGHNPPLPGATLVTGIGPARAPVDWEWLLPGGGGLFVHAGNNIWGNCDEKAVRHLIAERLVAWLLEERSEERVG